MLRKLLKLMQPDITIDTNAQHDTWHTCPECNYSWKDEVTTPGLIHSTVKCRRCKNDRKEPSKVTLFKRIGV